MRGFGALAAVVALILLGSVTAWAHGGDEMALKALKIQPARTLAQQALAELEVRGDTEDAALRLDAALESEDKEDIDLALLRRATETLDAGDPQGAVPLLDQALSRPLGAASGAALHEAGREFEPATGGEETVAIVLGTIALLAGVVLLWAPRWRSRSASQA